MKLRALIYLDAEFRDSAQNWAHQFALPCVDGSSFAVTTPKIWRQFLAEQSIGVTEAFLFILGENGLTLYAVEHGVSIRADFHGPTVTYRRKQGGGKGQMIAKAVGIRSGVYPYVLDATAGLGGDAFVLASLGCRVALLERVPAVCALLEDGIARARGFAILRDRALLDILHRMHLVKMDALKYLKEHDLQGGRPDVVYLDPMFPARTKSAMVKKEMRMFHSLVGSDNDADALLEAALACARYRVVVKRPRIAPALSGAVPSYVLEGKSNRYDVYTIQKLPDGLHAV